MGVENDAERAAVEPGRAGAWWRQWPSMGRLAFLAFSAAMAVAILGVSWSNYRSVLGVATSLNRDRALIFRMVVDRELRRGESLGELLVDHGGEGLRYVAAYDENGRLYDQAGTPVQAPPEVISLNIPFDPQQAPLVTVGNHVRLTTRSVPPRAFPSQSGRTPNGGGPPRAPGGPSTSGQRRRPAAVLVEFEPVASIRLTAAALRTFTLSSVVAPVLLGAAGFVWYLLRRREEYLLRIERQERLIALGEMSAVLAHEIRNPLASLKGNAQLLSERLAATAADRAKADRIVREASRLEKLTSDLLDFARSDSLTRTPTDPLRPLTSAIESVAAGSVEIDTARAPAQWSIDVDAMQQLLTNVLHNAVQATPTGERVEVRVGVDHDQLTYQIRDHGPGVQPGLEQRIFEPFVTTRTRGTGLGLAVAQRIARLHGGSISVATHPEGGALFSVAIPAR